jgi:hypothetical protein
MQVLCPNSEKYRSAIVKISCAAVSDMIRLFFPAKLVRETIAACRNGRRQTPRSARYNLFIRTEEVDNGTITTDAIRIA